MDTEAEPRYSIKQAVAALPFATPLPLSTLSQLGREASMVARIWLRPTGTVAVQGETWAYEKTYTQDVLREVFTRNPATNVELALHDAETGD